VEPISSHAEHARKCLKVEYLGRIEYEFKKSRVTGPWDHKDSVSAKKVFKKISCLCTFNITKIRIDDYSYICKQISLWNTYGISHSCGNFIFRFYNNILGTNARVFHFVPGINKTCTFCNIRGTPNPDPESFLHIFFTCATSAEWHGRFLSTYFPDIIFNSDAEKKILLFLGKLPDPHGHNPFIAVCVLIYQFCIWEAKLKKKIHSFHTIDSLFREKVEKLLFTNSKIRKSASKTNLFLRRTFSQAIRVDGPAYYQAGVNPVLPDVAHE
jgi:hypothetical protein